MQGTQQAPTSLGNLAGVHSQICENIAVRGCHRWFYKHLSMLLTDKAAVWWQDARPSTSTWSSTMEGIHDAFGKGKPPFAIYQDLFKLQQDATNTDMFGVMLRIGACWRRSLTS